MRKTSLVALLVAGALLVPLVVFASHQFNDVPDDHTFHNAIAWMADNGITVGCNPPANTNYCPEDFVTRGQMAAFMKRLHENLPPIGMAFNWRIEDDPPSFGDGAVLDMGLNTQIFEPGVLSVSASLGLLQEAPDEFLACGINTGGDVSLALPDSWRVVDLSNDWYDTCSTETNIFVSPGTQSVRLVITGAQSSTRHLGGSITAIFYPDDSSFGLLNTADDQAPAPSLPDASQEDG
jgi:hypothetical protein